MSPGDPTRPGTFEDCLFQPMLCECGREHRRGDFWGAWEGLFCACGRKIGYRCPWVSCEHHIRSQQSWGKQSAQPPESAKVVMVRSFCRVELVDVFGEFTLEGVGEQDGTTRERVRQIEKRALAKLTLRAKLQGGNAEALAFLSDVEDMRNNADRERFAMAAPPPATSVGVKGL